jgi:hypothetical protein
VIGWGWPGEDTSGAPTKPPTLLRDEGWGTLRGDLWGGQEEQIELIFFVFVKIHGDCGELGDF